MPPTCIAPGCDSGNPRKQIDGEHRHFFAVPKDLTMQAKWKRCMPIKEVTFTKNSKICDLHFEDEFILRFYETVINGEIVQLARGKVSLADGAYPTKFPHLDSYLAKKPRKRKKMLKTEAELEYTAKRVVTTTPGFSTLEEITDQVEAIQGKPPELTSLEGDDKTVAIVDIANVTVEESKLDLKAPLTSKLWKARDRIYYLTRQNNRLKKRNLELKLENRKMKKQASSVMESMDGLKSLPRRQQLIFEQAILQAQQKRGGMRYSPEWISDCIQLKIRSAAVYEFLRKCQYLPLPNPGTLYNFVKQRKVDLGISLQLLETLKDKNSTAAVVEPTVIETPLILDHQDIENAIIENVDIVIESSEIHDTVI